MVEKCVIVKSYLFGSTSTPSCIPALCNLNNKLSAIIGEGLPSCKLYQIGKNIMLDEVNWDKIPMIMRKRIRI